MAPSVVSMSTLYVLSLRTEEDLVDADGYVLRDRDMLMESDLRQRHHPLMGFNLRLIPFPPLLGWEGRSPV